MTKRFSYILLAILTGALLVWGAFSLTKNEVATTATPDSIVRCSNQTLALVASYDKASWTCVSVDEGADLAYMDISSDTIQVRIGNMGRGFFCGDVPAVEDSGVCEADDFPLTDNISGQLFKLDGANGEIYGSVQIGTGSWISIQWAGMETRELSGHEMEKLLELLNGISPINDCIFPCE